jgi:hypothetical protein
MQQQGERRLAQTLLKLHVFQAISALLSNLSVHVMYHTIG